MTLVIIVGAGASAAAAALQLSRIGIKPVVIDVGVEPGKTTRAEGNLYEWRAKHDSFQLHIGADYSGVSDVVTGETSIAKLNAPNIRYVTERAEELSPLDAEHFRAMQSFARGRGASWILHRLCGQSSSAASRSRRARTWRLSRPCSRPCASCSSTSR